MRVEVKTLREVAREIRWYNERHISEEDQHMKVRLSPDEVDAICDHIEKLEQQLEGQTEGLDKPKKLTHGMTCRAHYYGTPDLRRILYWDNDRKHWRIHDENQKFLGSLSEYLWRTRWTVVDWVRR